LRLGRLVRRERVDDWLDSLRFRLDSFPRSGWLKQSAHVHYQPVPVLGRNDASRAQGTESRWRAIEAVIDSVPPDALRPATGLDIGANTGYFTIALAEKGISTVAVEPAPLCYRTAMLAIRRAGLTGRAAVLVLALDPSNQVLLPEADVVLCLSVWHHFVREFGFETATTMLEQIWRQTRMMLFFETGEDEMPTEFGLPSLEPDAQAWLAAFLATHCEGGSVEHLGLHQAFDADLNSVQRNLFVVRRNVGAGAQANAA
jgi:methyltransferase family protein